MCKGTTASCTGVIYTTGAKFGLDGCATCWCCSFSASWPPGGSQIVTTTSTVSITSTVVVTVTSCLFSNGMAKDKAKRAPNARDVDSFIVPDEESLDIYKFERRDERITSVLNRLAIILLRCSFRVDGRSFCKSGLP